VSVVSSYRTRIKLAPPESSRTEEGLDPTWRIMAEAVETVAREYGGSAADAVTDYYGQRIHCDFAVITPDFPRGVGVRVEPSGDVVFVYDHYGGYQKVAAEISERITQNYTALAVARALEEMNYSVEVDEHRERPAGAQAVVVRGSL